jgi:hypothetical protein
MNTQPLALALADKLEQGYLAHETVLYPAAAELRRLHEAHEWQYTMAGERLRRIEKLDAEVHAWVKENSPGGWIDNLRAENEALRGLLHQCFGVLTGPTCHQSTQWARLVETLAERLK